MKKILFVIIVALLTVSLFACNNDKLESYKEAVQKTEEIKKGQASGDFIVAMDFDTTGLNKEQLKQLQFIQKMEGSWNVIYDHDAKKSIFRNYLNMGGLGVDYNFYNNGEKSYIKLPIVGKYLRINNIIEDENCREFISRETIEEINKTWLNIIKQEDVFKGEKILITTGDGEVKATQYSIQLKDEQLKILVDSFVTAITRDEKIRTRFESVFKNNDYFKKEVTFQKLTDRIKDSLSSYQVNNFKYEAYVDIDGYIVNENLEFEITFDNNQTGSLNGLKYTMGSKNWSLNKEQKFDFPILTEENTYNGNKAGEDIPFMFQDMFKNRLKEGE